MPRSPKFDLTNAIGFVVNRTAYMLRQAVREGFTRHGVALTPEELAILAHLWQRDGQTQGELAGCSIRDRTTVTRIIDRLSEKGLTRREPGVRDRRRVRTWLTAEGKRLEKVVLPLAATRLRKVTQGISDADMRTTLESLRKVQANLIAIKQAEGGRNGKTRK